MNSQEIYKEVINIPEVVSYITKEPFRYKIVPFVDHRGTGINTTIIAERNIDSTFMKYDHDVLQISVQRSEHMPSYKITMPYPEFFIYENESIDTKTPLFYMGTFYFCLAGIKQGKGSGKHGFSRGGSIETARFQGAKRREISCQAHSEKSAS